MKSLFIGDIEIRQFKNGYRITDFFLASGAKRHKQPNKFLDLDSTKELIDVLKRGSIQNQQVINTIHGDNGATYVCKELVYAYAMWVKPQFYVDVVRAFDALLHNQPEEAQRIVSIYQGHQPSHPNSLPALLGIPKHQSKPYFDHLRQRDIIGVTYEPRLPQAIYHAGIEAGDLVIGKHGHTLLFSEEIKDVFPAQRTWLEK